MKPATLNPTPAANMAHALGLLEGHGATLDALGRGVERADARQLDGDALREQFDETALHGGHDTLDGGAVEHRAVFRHVLAESAGVQRTLTIDVGVQVSVVVGLSVGVCAQVNAHLNVLCCHSSLVFSV